MTSKSQLSNGVRILTEAMPHSLSATLGIWVENGSRYEEPHENGVSHLIEHLLFKGTKRRTAAQIAEEIDAVGGVLNAFTGKEYTCYYAKVLGGDLEMATDLLADLLLESLFDPEEIKREQQVVLQEISQAEDTPDDFIHDLFNLKFWAGHPLALPIAGSVATVTGLDRGAMTSFMGQRYRAERVFVAAAGKVDHDALIAQCERLFGGIAGDGKVDHDALVAQCQRLFGAIPGDGKVDSTSPPKVHSLVLNHEKPLEQAHICLGGPGISHGHPIRYAAYVLNTALGGGMSSRLFQEVREKRGKVYAIYSFLSSHIDCGYFAIYAGTNPEWVDEVLEITLGELKQVAREGLRRPELDRAKSQLKGNLLLGLESTDSRMNRLARNEIYFRRDIPVEELARDIEAVTNDQVVELANTFFDRAQMALVVLGDLKGRELPADIFSAL